MMQKNFPGERWHIVHFDFPFTNVFRLEVSDFGRVRTFNKISAGNILKGSMINGYRIIRLKLYKPREEKVQVQLDYLQQQVTALSRQIKLMKKDTLADENKITEAMELLAGLKKKLSKKYKADLKKRTINYHTLVHRLVADYFLDKPASEKTIVAHLDHNKQNNKASNLQWMTTEENYAHQKQSPLVIKEKEERKIRRKEHSRATKLTVTKVMFLKKLLNEGIPLKQLVKQFKVTDTQILRIKRGENWSDIEAAQ